MLNHFDPFSYLTEFILNVNMIKNIVWAVFILGKNSFSYRLMKSNVNKTYKKASYVAPSGDDPIETNKKNGAKLSVAVWADIQVSNYMFKRARNFDAVCEDIIKNVDGKLDAILVAGDMAENGLLCEYQYMTDKLTGAKTENFINAVGNHDVRLKACYKNTVKRFCSFTNTLNKRVGSGLTIDSLHYSYELNGYKFIVLGTDKTKFEESYFYEEQFAWLDSELAEATKTGKPAFVICHQPFCYTHGLPDTWDIPIESAGSIGKQSDRVKAILNKYDNVFYLTGHLHNGIGKFTYEKIGRINSVSLPALTMPNSNGDCNEIGIGFIMEVYDNHILFRARNFVKGEYLPDFDVDIPLCAMNVM